MVYDNTFFLLYILSYQKIIKQVLGQESLLFFNPRLLILSKNE